MAYGQGEYAQRGFGGSDVGPEGPYFVVTSPVQGADGVVVFDPLILNIASTSGLDLNTLVVSVNGQQAMVAEDFIAPFAGTFTHDPETSLVINLTSHPDFAGSNTVTVLITDLAGINATLILTFSTANMFVGNETITITEDTLALPGVAPGETVSLTENLLTSHAMTEGLAETVSVSAVVSTGDFEVYTYDDNTLEVVFPFEFHFDNSLVLDNYVFLPDPTLGDSGNPIAVWDPKLQYQIIDTGSEGTVISDLEALPWDYDRKDGVSNIFEFEGNLNPTNLGDFLFLGQGINTSIYQIQEILQDSGPARVKVDKPLVLNEATNGIVVGTSVSLSAITNTIGNLTTPTSRLYFVVDHPRVTPSNPLTQVFNLERLARLGDPSFVALNTPAPVGAEVLDEVIISTDYDLTTLVLEDYKTFSISATGQPLIRGTAPAIGSCIESFNFAVQVKGEVAWTHTSGVKGIKFSTNRLRNNRSYSVTVRNLYLKYPRTVYPKRRGFFLSQGITNISVLSASCDDEGYLTVVFNQPLRSSAVPTDFTVTGPSSVTIKRVLISENTATLELIGLVSGNYTVTAIGVADRGGNPVDTMNSSVVLSTTTPIKTRSIFAYKGPLAKAPLVLQTGATATVVNFETLSLPGAALTNSHMGLDLKLSGSALNNGTHRILEVLSATTCRIRANLNDPDPNSGSIGWSLVNPRNGMIADEPSDVEVLINNLTVVPEEVRGLEGQIILASEPLPSDTVVINYHYLKNPTVEMRGLNNRGFRLNSHKSQASKYSGRAYPYQCTLLRPDNYTADDIQAKLAAPQLRNVKYRAFERAYTASLNDPNTLRLNVPKNKIGYPSTKKILTETVVFFEGTTLPEAAGVPWVRKGAGSASSSLGVLTQTTVQEPLFWYQGIDLTYEHILSAAWRFSVTSTTNGMGVWSGISAGFSDPNKAYIVGYLDDAGVKKIGLFKAGAQEHFEGLTSWIGGLDLLGAPTNAPVEFDWASGTHSYRISQGKDGTVKVYFDGDITPSLTITPSEAPALEEVNAAFDLIQGAYFGSLGSASNTVVWDFYRYLIQPIGILQTAPASFVSYEGSILPELDSSPWVPVGYHGDSAITASKLRLDTTSACDAPQGVVTGDYRGYFKFEPLLSASAEYVLDFGCEVLNATHSTDPDGVFAAVDDGEKLAQLSFISDTTSPKLSYGGRLLPEDFTPTVWTSVGGQTARLLGRHLLITDANSSDGKVYAADDNYGLVDSLRTLKPAGDYAVSSKLKVVSYTADPQGFVGAMVHAYDSDKSVGIMLLDVAGVRKVQFHSEGFPVGSPFNFDWAGAYHTYTFRKDYAGDLVTLFIDNTFVGNLAYSSFFSPPFDPVGQLSFGSATTSSAQSNSVVEWVYCNAWGIPTGATTFVGIWKGSSYGNLRDFHTPLKISGTASIQGNTLEDLSADFTAASVGPNDYLIVDSGPNAGIYTVNAVVTPQGLTINGLWPAAPTAIEYRILKSSTWGAGIKYRIVKAGSSLDVFIDTDLVASLGYTQLPESAVGLPSVMADGLPSVSFGSFSAENLNSTLWDFVRYGVVRTNTAQQIVPIHHVLNQWNVMESPERLFTVIPHTLTGFKSSSTGITPQTDPDFLKRQDVLAYTQLNEGTPPVPMTQTWEVRGPFTIQEDISTLPNPEDVLAGNGAGASYIQNGIRFTVAVPDDILYTKLQVIEQSSGAPSLITPFNDELDLGGLDFTNEVCLTYLGAVLPEDDTAGTPWVKVSDVPGNVATSAASSILTYGTTAAAKTLYHNATPLLSQNSLSTEVTFNLKLEADATLGLGDSQVRFGLTAPGMVVGIAFITTPAGDRHVRVVDMVSNTTLGYANIDYLDGNYHTYKILRNPGTSTVQISIE